MKFRRFALKTVLGLMAIAVLGLIALGVAGPGSMLVAADPNPTVTFNRDVLPILQNRCQTCHRPGDIAPMSLLNYQQARPWAKAIKSAVLLRRMPPWHADPAHGEFSNDRSLTPSEARTIVQWVDSGAPEGAPKDAPKPREFSLRPKTDF